MKTNISNLMNLVSEYERNFNMADGNLREHIYSTTIEELDGRKNVIEDFKQDFADEFEEYNELFAKIQAAKKIIAKKNNELTLSNGETIADALISINLLRKKMYLMESFLNYKNSKRRVTEVNNSYFESKEVNFDVAKIKEEYTKIQEQIQNLEFEISKLNSIEFEVEW
ncbi:MAG: hypothetical protein IJ217_00480 [Clostridia bacterium]|nr:hypothetical protein [Clostridia bacterium]